MLGAIGRLSFDIICVVFDDAIIRIDRDDICFSSLACCCVSLWQCGSRVCITVRVSWLPRPDRHVYELDECVLRVSVGISP